jgi:hypothetical protein
MLRCAVLHDAPMLCCVERRRCAVLCCAGLMFIIIFIALLHRTALYHRFFGLICLQEYQRAAHVLAGIDSPVAVFLRCYALYLAGEKRKE